MITHAGCTPGDARLAEVDNQYRAGEITLALRSRDESARFFGDFDVLEPGLAPPTSGGLNSASCRRRSWTPRCPPMRALAGGRPRRGAHGRTRASPRPSPTSPNSPPRRGSAP
ncbi:hypothetical protein ABT001_08140 [Streptomyces sp. NPDC002793]|uniref:hypothetical protein n=1 Tax=Streptomyces sp. NPDC002793 TaxID=3154432 RepID=UPI003322193E